MYQTVLDNVYIHTMYTYMWVYTMHAYRCIGSEKLLSDCSGNRVYSQTHVTDAGVVCKTPQRGQECGVFQVSVVESFQRVWAEHHLKKALNSAWAFINRLPENRSYFGLARKQSLCMEKFHVPFFKVTTHVHKYDTEQANFYAGHKMSPPLHT